MENFFNWLGSRLKWSVPLLVLGVIVALAGLGADILMTEDRFLYPALLVLIWSVLGLIFVWWFQPPGPNAVLLTTGWGRFKAKMARLVSILKCWTFLALLLGSISLTVRFVMLWQG